MAGGVAPKGGRKGRKIGKGKSKAAHSRWGTYAGILAHGDAVRQRRELARLKRLAARAAKRVCNICGQQGFRDRRALKRHRKKGHPGHTVQVSTVA